MKAYPLVKPLYRYMLTVLCLTLVVLVWLYVVYFVNQQKIKQEQFRLQEYQKQITTLPKLQTDIDQLDTEIKQVQLDIANQQEGLIIKSGQDALSYIFDQAQKHELVCGSCTIDKEIDKDWHTKHYLSLELKGQFVQILAFLDTLKNSHTMLQSKTISLAKSGDTVSAKTLLAFSIVK